jgi:nucleotide-binding universal stress UspA family protein
MVQRVLVPLDGAESAALLSPTLCAFFAVGEVEFVLFDCARRGREKASSSVIDENAHLLREAGYFVQVVCAGGDPAQSILNYVSEQGVDMVAIVSQSDESAAVRERVLRGVNVPVLIMRAAE